MAKARYVAGWLAAALLLGSGTAAQASEPMAGIVPRADDTTLKLSIENIDGKVVNVPEANLRQIPPGDHYLGIKIEFRSVSGGSLISGLGIFSAISGAVSDTPPAHDSVSFTAEPGRRYLVNGAMVNGKPKIWIDEEIEEDTRDDDLR